jgi:hypothetical protein
MAWNDVDGTINIDMGFDGVTQQVGLEQYTKIYNNSGSTIIEGDVVGFGGVAGADLIGVKYIANGTMPNGYLFGVATMDIPTGDFGYITTYGNVNGVNTSTHSVGDILWASPTVAGGVTHIRPLAPNIAIPIGIVLAVGNPGKLWVRPTISLTTSNGTFYCTNTHPLTINVPSAVPFNTTAYSNGLVVGVPNSRIVCNRAGFYDFSFSLQVDSASASSQKITVWPRVNGVDVPFSATEMTISGSATIVVPAWNWNLTMNVGDYFEIIVTASVSSMSLVAKAAQTVPFIRPAVPSAYLTVSQIY